MGALVPITIVPDPVVKPGVTATGPWSLALTLSVPRVLAPRIVSDDRLAPPKTIGYNSRLVIAPPDRNTLCGLPPAVSPESFTVSAVVPPRLVIVTLPRMFWTPPIPPPTTTVSALPARSLKAMLVGVDVARLVIATVSLPFGLLMEIDVTVAPGPTAVWFPFESVHPPVPAPRAMVSPVSVNV